MTDNLSKIKDMLFDAFKACEIEGGEEAGIFYRDEAFEHEGKVYDVFAMDAGVDLDQLAQIISDFFTVE